MATETTERPKRDPSEMGMPARHRRLTTAASNALKLLEDMEAQAALRLPFPGYDETKKALTDALDPVAGRGRDAAKTAPP